MERPKSITRGEFCAKMRILEKKLEQLGKKKIYLCSEGAMRWLTGIRHQVVDIAANTPTTVHVVVETKPNTSLLFYSEPWESNRVHDIIERGIWNECGVEASYGGTSPDLTEEGIASPLDENYAEIERSIVSPLAEGNQKAKLDWLVSESRQALMEIAAHMEEGMTGWDLRTLVYHTYHQRHLELNLVMLGLSKMKRHLHPVVEDDSVVEPGTVVKIAIGARYFDMFHSATQLVKIGEAPAHRELVVHHALQEATLAYADQFTAGAVEKDLHAALGPIFKKVEETHGLEGFGQSAHLHHAGGPLSPLGNRDFVIAEKGQRQILPYSQFSVNPVDALEFLKFELQGIVLPAGPPQIIDEFAWCEATTDKPPYDSMEWRGTTLRLPTIITHGDT